MRPVINLTTRKKSNKTNFNYARNSSSLLSKKITKLNWHPIKPRLKIKPVLH